MSDEVDFEAREKAYKGLIVICIITTALLNLVVIIRGLSSGKRVLSGPRGTRPLILISLSVGDLVGAFFTLTITAHNVYEQTSYRCPKSHVLAVIYFFNTVPFVYAVGLVLLVLESLHARRRSRAAGTTHEPSSTITMVNWLISVLPWILGLLVVLPLTMVYVEFVDDYCNGSSKLADKLQTVTIICNLVPPFVVVFIALVYAFISSEEVQQGLVIRHANVPGNVHLSTTEPGNPTGYPYHIEMPPPYPGYGVDSAINRQGLPVQTQVDQAASYGQAQSPETHTQTRSSEKRIHVLAAFIFCFCCLPAAIYNVAYAYNNDRKEMDPLPSVVIYDVVTWLLRFRATFMACFWLLSGILTLRN